MWFGKNQVRLYLNEAKNFSIGGGGPRGPPLNTPLLRIEYIVGVYRPMPICTDLSIIDHETVYYFNLYFTLVFCKWPFREIGKRS